MQFLSFLAGFGWVSFIFVFHWNSNLFEEYTVNVIEEYTIRMEGGKAPACHLRFDDKVAGDILVQDVHVPDHGVAMFTYYCCMQFNTGQNGGGYCGIQEHRKGKKCHFSLWDPKTTDEAIEVVYQHPGTKTRRFTHEGYGLRSQNFDVSWKPDQWHTLVIRRWDCKGHTYFGFWFRSHDEDRWEHVITMDYPVPEVHFQTKTAAFIEDWSKSGEKYRRVHLKNGYKRKLDKSWLPFVKAKFSVNRSPKSAMYADNYDGGRHEDGFFMQTGHGTTPSPEILDDKNVSVPNAADDEPSNPPILFTIQEVTSEKITWSVPESSTPQFAYTILIDGVEVASEIDARKRSYDVMCFGGSEVEVVLEDILGKRTSKKMSTRQPYRDMPCQCASNDSENVWFMQQQTT